DLGRDDSPLTEAASAGRKRGEPRRVGEDVDPDPTPPSAEDAPCLCARGRLRLAANVDPVEAPATRTEGTVLEAIDRADPLGELRDPRRQHPDADRAAIGSGGEAAGGVVTAETTLTDRVAVQRSVGPDVAPDVHDVVAGRSEEVRERVVDDVARR